MYTLQLLFLSAFVALARAQYCPGTTCSSCLAPQDPNCVWCPTSLECQYTYNTPASCTTTPVENPQLCPAIAPASALTLSLHHAQPLGVVVLVLPVLILLFVFSCSPVERACGIRASLSSVSAYRPSVFVIVLLFLASSLLWLGSLLFVASPSLVWLLSIQTLDFPSDGAVNYVAASAFYFLQCAHLPAISSSSDSCDILQLGDLVNTNSYIPSQVVSFVDSSTTIGIVVYCASAVLLLLPALMTSIATVRVSKLRRYGVPAYLGGCSPASLAVAFSLGLLGFITAAVVLILAEN
jgi:hypothetical protein